MTCQNIEIKLFNYAFKDGTCSSKYIYKKKTDDAAHNYVLKDVDNFTQQINLMEEKINISQFEDFFELQSLVDYAKMLINTSQMKTKKLQQR